jgi:hypothetical protein
MPLPLPLAHGLVQRADLPLPEWLFGWAAGVVLLVSFVALAVLWPQPKLERPGWRALRAPLDRLLTNRAVRVACALLGVVLLVLTIVSGYAGPPGPLENFAPTFVYVAFWVGLVFASILLGDVFRAFNPWLAIGRAIERVTGRRPRREAELDRLAHWPAVAGLAAFAWIELASIELPGGGGQDPRTLATLVLAYTVVTLVAMLRYGAEPWAERGETFGVYFNLLSRVSVFDVREHRLGVRRPLSGLTGFTPRPGTIWLLAVMIGATTFDGFSQGSAWQSLGPDIAAFFEGIGASLDLAAVLTASVGLALAVLAVALFYALGCAGARSVGGDLDGRRLRGGFVHSLVPIAVVYVLAHYLTFLVFQGQAMAYLSSDPLGRGWDLFGTAGSAIDYGVLGQNATWYLQVGFVVLGHVAALTLAHDRALTIYDNARLAVRSQYWMLAVMIGFTTLALWLLASAGA